MVGIEDLLLVAVVGAEEYLIIVIFEAERTGIVDTLEGNVVSLLEIPLCVMSVRIGAGALGISRDILGVLEPPCIGKVCLGEKDAGRSLGNGSADASLGRQGRHAFLQVREDAPGVHLGNGIADGSTYRGGVESEFTGTQVERNAAEHLDHREVLESAEEFRLRDQGRIETHRSRILDDAVGSIDIGEGPEASLVAVGRRDETVSGHVGGLEVAVGGLGVSGLVGTGRQEVVRVRISVDGADMGVQCGQTAFDAGLGREEVRRIAGLRMLFENEVARGKEKGRACKGYDDSVLFHIPVQLEG